MVEEGLTSWIGIFGCWEGVLALGFGGDTYYEDVLGWWRKFAARRLSGLVNCWIGLVDG